MFARLLRPRTDPRAGVRPLWGRVVAIARLPAWYAADGVPDTMAGRFDVLSAVTALVLLRLESSPALAREAALLTEIFIEDMDGQLRQQGVGDLVVGRHVGQLVSVLGGRLGAYRDALAEEGDASLEEAIRRNVTLANESDAGAVAVRLRRLFRDLLQASDGNVLAGAFGAEP